MSKQIYLHIPEPCHENWDAMSPVQQGRFCGSCSKQVVDFSSMSDKQILDVLSKATGKTCGRFSADQLQRPVVKEMPPLIRPHKILLSTLIPVFIVSGAASCQDKLTGKVAAKPAEEVVQLMGDTVMVPEQQLKIKGIVVFDDEKAAQGVLVSINGTDVKTATNARGEFELPYPADLKKITISASTIGFTTQEVQVQRNNLKPIRIQFLEQQAIVAGMISTSWVDDEQPSQPAAIKPARQVTVKGKVLDKKGVPIPNASIKIRGLQKEIAADSTGGFIYTDWTKDRHDHIKASAIGYKEYIAKIDYSENTDDLKLMLEPEKTIKNLAASCSFDPASVVFTGGLSIVHPVTIKDTAITFIKKVFDNEMFKAFPNPSVKGSVVNFAFKKAGDYSIQIFDNSGKLYLQKEVSVGDKQSATQLTMPETMTAGMYYVKAVNATTNKQFIDKIIIR